MRLLAIVINGLLDLKNFYPVALELTGRYSMPVDVLEYRPDRAGLASEYDALIVGSDWNANGAIVEAFRAAGKPTILLQSEGMFIEATQWYGGIVPVTDLACLWGPEHERIFAARGYRGQAVVTGPPRFDIYHQFRPGLDRTALYARLGLEDEARDYVLFLGQFFPIDEFGEALFQSQIALTEYACRTPASHYALIKCHPQELAARFFSRAEIAARDGHAGVRVVDRGVHTEKVDPSTLIHHAAAIVTFSSTGAFEALMLGRPAAVFEGGVASPLCDGRIASLPSVTSPEDLLDLAGRPPDASAAGQFLARFLPGPADGSYTAKAADAIAGFLHRRATIRRMEQALAAESDTQTIDPEAYRQVAIQAHQEAAGIILDMLRPAGLTASDVARLSHRPQSGTVTTGEYYQGLHERDTGYRTNNWLVPELPRLGAAAAGTIVEIGCGNGRFLRAAAAVAAQVIGVDFARSPLLADLPEKVRFVQADVVRDELPRGDLCCSADVLEHFQAADVLAVLARLHAIAIHQYHLIACYDDGHSHATIASPAIWLAMFRSLSPAYRIADIRPRRNDPRQIVCVIANY